MTNDDRGGFKPEDDSQAGDPAEAFEALRHTVEDLAGDLTREMTTIRKGVEAAFDQFEKFQQPPDYGPDLGRVVQHLAHVGERLEAVEKSPILKNGPEHYARSLERSGASLIHTAAQELEGKGRDLEREANNLAAYTKSAYDRKSQDLRMWMAGAAGLFVGVFLILLLPRILPFSADTHVAATVMGQSRWGAGLTMMQAHNQTRLNDFLYADELVQANRDAVAACYQRALDSNEDQRCTITVAVPPTQPGQ